nr:MAG TPA_asm: hypothetical protein [Caudoviricetes sp.]
MISKMLSNMSLFPGFPQAPFRSRLSMSAPQA